MKVKILVGDGLGVFKAGDFGTLIGDKIVEGNENQVEAVDKDMGEIDYVYFYGNEIEEVKVEGNKNHSNFYHPPLLPMPDIPVPNHYGAYLQKRKHDVHTGVDLYVDDGTPVYAVEKGKVVIVKWFTGEKAESPWWRDTQAIYVKGFTGTICYGEVESLVKEGDEVVAGQVIAQVKRVLNKDKGKATSMLHFALCRHSLDLQVKHNEDPNADNFYDLQLDPTLLLLQLKSKADTIMLTR